ncbi:hypothetical protein SCHPADRAFT_696213 [Schizopora paradoxa]|uniref:Uncharacterized protein n=1 Tax=Schizopora paradoxa TaxID=27342 RepID=A0A0H2R4H0_9AGAM|nr:hypothetical protein SCHPADRAFT_696213 [Schizopora paradoxa]
MPGSSMTQAMQSKYPHTVNDPSTSSLALFQPGTSTEGTVYASSSAEQSQQSSQPKNMSSTSTTSDSSLRAFSKRIGDSVALALAKTAPTQVLSLQQVSSQIRRLCLHDDTTLRQRHADFQRALCSGRISTQDMRSLKALCAKLVSFMSKDEKQLNTKFTEEVFALAVKHPIIYTTIQTCVRDDSTLNIDATIFDFFSSDYYKDIYRRWSIFFANHQGNESMESYVEAVKETLSSSQLNIMAGQCLACALSLEVIGSEALSLLDLWEYLLGQITEIDDQWDIVTARPWCRILDICIENILLSGKSIHQFLRLSRNVSERLSALVEQYPGDFPSLFAVFFAAPSVFFHRDTKTGTVEISGVEFQHQHAYARGWDVAQTVSSIYKFSAHPVILSSSGRSKYPGVKNGLPADTWTMFYEVADHVLECYQRGFGLWHSQAEGRRFSSWIRKRFAFLIELSLDLLANKNNNGPASSDETGALATFFIAQSFDIDCYTKAAIKEEVRNDNREVETRKLHLLNTHSMLYSPVKVLNGLYNLAYLPLLDHTPFLRRFNSGGKMHISLESLPGLSDGVIHSRSDILGEMTVDTMLIDKHSLIFLRCRFGALSEPFEVTGHFPLLAGYDDKTGKALYVALVHWPGEEVDRWYLTCVEDGAILARYIDEVGEEKPTEEFFVLALRHDPSDIVPPYPQTHKGAMDPTGPLHWLPFWPKKDPEYFEDERLRKADEALESILVGIQKENVLLSGFEKEEEGQFSWFEDDLEEKYGDDDQLICADAAAAEGENEEGEDDDTVTLRGFY